VEILNAERVGEDCSSGALQPNERQSGCRPLLIVATSTPNGPAQNQVSNACFLRMPARRRLPMRRLARGQAQPRDHVITGECFRSGKGCDIGLAERICAQP